MTEKIRFEQSFDMTHVKDVLVVQRERARLTDGANPGAGELQDVDEVLLADGSVVYQCVSRAGGCGEVWPSPRQVISHLKVHQGVYAARRAQQELTDLRAKIEADAAAERRRRSEAGKKAVIAREAKRAAATQEKKPKTETETGSVTSNLDEQTQTRRDAALERWNEGVRLVTQGMKVCQEAAQELVKLTRGVDPEVAAKAAKFDQMQSLLGGTTAR